MREEDLWGLLVSVIIIWYAIFMLNVRLRSVLCLGEWGGISGPGEPQGTTDYFLHSPLQFALANPPERLLNMKITMERGACLQTHGSCKVCKKKTWPYSILKYSSFVVSIKIRCLKRIDRKGELKRLRRIFWQMEWFLVPFVAKCTRVYVYLRSTRNIVML